MLLTSSGSTGALPSSCAHARPQHTQRRPCRRAPHSAPRALQQAEQQESDAERQREVLQAVTRRIKELGEQRKFKQAVQELAGLAELGVQPDTRAGTALLAACARSRDMSMAENIFNELFGGSFLSPDEVTFCVLLRGYGARDPPDWPGMDAVLTRMRSQHGLEPGAACYNALLEVCYRTADSDRALDVIDRMAAEGIEPDSLTLDIVARKRTWRSYMRKTFG